MAGGADIERALGGTGRDGPQAARRPGAAIHGNGHWAAGRASLLR